MARNRFGGSTSSFVVADGGPDTPYKRLHTPPTVAFWSGPPTDLDRVAYDDLRALDDPTTVIAAVPALPSGDLPEFYGPDDVTVLAMWVSADGGSTGTWLSANDPTGAIDQGDTDTLTAAQAYADDQVGAIPALPSASTTTQGKVELATPTETTTGTDTVRATTPAGVKAAIDALQASLLGGASSAWDTLQELKALVDSGDAADQTAIANLVTVVGQKLAAADLDSATAALVGNLTSALRVALSAAFGPGSDQWLKLIAQDFGFVFTGGLTVDATTGLPTAGDVKWPDAKTGVFAATVDANYYTGFTVTWVNGGTTKTVTVTGITYDTTNGLPLGPTGLAVA